MAQLFKTEADVMVATAGRVDSVSYTHLTLPTKA